MAYLRTTHFVMAGGDGKWIFQVEGSDNAEFFVSCPKECVLVDGEADWIPVAVCAKDEDHNVALVEFPPGSVGAVSRLWVCLDDLKFGTTHAHLFGSDVEFPVLQVAINPKLTAWDERIRVVLIETTAEAAQMECDRLNRLKGKDGCIHFWQPARKPRIGR